MKQKLHDEASRQMYWKKREQELDARKQEAEEKKAKYAGAGMKYTAIAMSNRS